MLYQYVFIVLMVASVVTWTAEVTDSLIAVCKCTVYLSLLTPETINYHVYLCYYILSGHFYTPTPKLSCLSFLLCLLDVIVTAMHGGCNYLAVQVHYFIWTDNDLSGLNTVRC